MALITDADKVYAGAVAADRAYQGANLVWSSWSEPVPAAPVYWLRADGITGLADGAAVTTWPAVQGAAAVKNPNAISSPTYVASGRNGRPTVRFGDTSTLLMPGLGAALANRADYAVFYVGATNAIGNYPVVVTAPQGTAWTWLIEYNIDGNWYWGSNNGMYNLYHPSVLNTNGMWRMFSHVMTAGSPQMWIDGGACSVSGTGPNGPLAGAVPSSVGSNMLLGGYYANNLGLSGDIAEIIFYDRALTGTERQQVETYLRGKWGLP